MRGEVRPPTQRATVLWEIALNYHNLVDQLGGGYSETDVKAIGTNPLLYTHTVKEFERLAKLARSPQAQHDLYEGEVVMTLGWHLLEYAIKAEQKVTLKAVTVKQHGKTRTLLDSDRKVVKRPVRDWIRHPAASERLARACCGWMGEMWMLPSEPMLPQPFLETLRVA